MFFERVGELKAALGPQAAGGVGHVETLLAEGLAARDRGDRTTALARVVEAMQRLAELATAGGSPEGPVLRMKAERFREAVSHADVSQAKDAAEVMREQSGSRVVPKKTR